MSKQIISFFDWNRVELSRKEYLGQTIKRLFLFGAFYAIYLVLAVIFGWDAFVSPSTEISESSLAAYARDPMPRLVAFVLFVPIELRRMKDADIAYWWLIVYYFLLYLPVPPSGEDYISQQNLHAAVSDIPAYLFQALLLLKPGKSYLAHKTIFKKRERGSDKVTFSE